MLYGLKSREDAEFALSEFLDKLNHDYSKEIIDELMKKGFTRGLSTKMISDPAYLKNLMDIELCVLNSIAYKYISVKDLNPKKYFNLKEIEQADEYKKIEEKDESNIILFNDVFLVNESPEQYQSKGTIKFINSITNRGLYSYDYSIQREAKRRVKREKITKIPTIYDSKKKEIVNTIKNKRPIGNTTITVVVPPIGNENFEYNKDTNTLKITIDENTKFYICDGFHRWVASNEIYSSTSEFDEYNWTFNIWHISMDLAEELTVNIDKQTKMKDLHTKVKNKQDVAMVLTNEINNYGTNEMNPLFHKFEEDIKDMKYDEAYTTFQIFSEALKYNFEKEINGSLGERIQLRKFLLNSFVYIIGVIFEKEFSNKKENWENTFAVHPNSFIGYIAILSKLYKDSLWEDKIEKTINAIDFSINNKDLVDIGIRNENITKKRIAIISDYFKTLV